MLGAIIGDIAGSRFERDNIKSRDFEFFEEHCRITDDSLMTLAVAKAILEAEKQIKPSVSEFGFDIEYDELLSQLTVRFMRELGLKYPAAGYGKNFRDWLLSEAPHPYGSIGNGAAMRISPAGWAARTEAEAIRLSDIITNVTHNTEEALMGAEAVAVAIYMARYGYLKSEIRNRIALNYYPLDFTIDEIRPSYQFSATCAGTVPQAIQCFLEAASFEDTVRTAISLGGDSDTIAAIAGSMAEAYYGIPAQLSEKALTYLTDDLRDIVSQWQSFLGSDQSRFRLLTKYIAPFTEGPAVAEPSPSPLDRFFDETADEDDEDDEDFILPAEYDLPEKEDRPILLSFLEEVHQFAQANPEFAMTDYELTLEKLGSKRDAVAMAAADPMQLDAQGILALVMAAVSTQEIKGESLTEFLADGSILNWLKRLKALDAQSAPKKLREIYLEIGSVSDTMIYQALVQDEEASLFRYRILDEAPTKEPYSLADPERLTAQWDEIHTEYWKFDYPNKSLPLTYDGEQWLLYVRKEGQRGDIYKGDSTYPPNWDKLLDLFRIQK